MIISFGGRLGSGKSELSTELIKIGFEKISFADYLKKLLSETFNLNFNDFYSQEKNKIFNIPIIWDERTAKKIFDFANIDYKYDIEVKQLWSIREMMQYIGTDVLRKHDQDFHIKKTMQNIDLKKNYVCDDVRYKNELNALKEINSFNYYLIRPNNFNISNHISETSLTWVDFDYHLFNDRDVASLKKDFINHLKYIDYTPKQCAFDKNQIILTRASLINYLEQYNYNTNKVAEHINCSRDKIALWSKRWLIHLPRYKYKSNNLSFCDINKYSSYYAGLLSADGCIKQSGKCQYSYCIELVSNDIELIQGFRSFIESDKPIYSKIHKMNGKIGYYFNVNNQYIIENIKSWNLKPRKSRNNEIPDIIKNDDKMLNYWFLGLIDGDGCVFVSNNLPFISILASKEIILFAKKYFNLPCCITKNVKKINNLWNISFCGKKAIKIRDQIYDPIGLQRKWNKIKNFSLSNDNKIIRNIEQV